MDEAPYVAAQRFSPSTSRLRRFWRGLNPTQKQLRWQEAKRREQTVLEVRRLIAAGAPEAVAVAQLKPPLHRSTYRNWTVRYDRDGLDGLVSCLQPPPQETVPEDIQQVVCTLRRSDPDYGVAHIVAFVQHHHGRQISGTSVKRILKRAGLAWPAGRPSIATGRGAGRVLQLGGMKLLEAAGVSTGYLESLTQTVVAHVAALATPAQALGPDTGHRDEHGRFLVSYNERYRKQEQDSVGPGFQSIELKRRFKDPQNLHVRGASAEVVERKLWALMCSPVIGTGSWDGMRTNRGKLLDELCGYPYMPSTLQLFTSELKYVGIADALWEAHARVWHEQTQGWGAPRHAAVLFVDGTTKPIWTQLFSQSTHVSLLNRTMPGLDVMAFHNGYGVPLWYLAHSGRAPLVNVVPEAINKLEERLGQIVARIVVIDAEGNSVPFLKGLEQANRGWVTRLRPSLVENKRVLNWSIYQPYRNGERIREGEVELLSSDKDTLPIRLVEVQRPSTGDVTYFGASKHLRAQDWETNEIADLYYDRWPHQELKFRDVNQATGIKQVHGYGKRMVENVAVVTRLEELRQRSQRAHEHHAKQVSEVQRLEQELHTQASVEGVLHEGKTTLTNTVAEVLAADTETALDCLRSLHNARELVESEIKTVAQSTTKLCQQLAKAEALAANTAQRIAAQDEERNKLESMTQILSHDVELDSIFNVLKVGLTMLVTYVLTQMLGKARLTPATFLERIATLSARQQFHGKYEIITFDYNARDPNTMALLIAQCSAINEMNLPMRSGRILRIAVNEPDDVETDKQTPLRRPKRKIR